MPFARARRLRGAHALLAVVQAFIMQASHTALANGTGEIEERMARWLLDGA